MRFIRQRRAKLHSRDPVRPVGQANPTFNPEWLLEPAERASLQFERVATLLATVVLGASSPATCVEPAPAPPSVAAEQSLATDGQPGRSAGHSPRGKNIDARMLKVLAENKESCGWTARTWAAHLACSDGTVKGTQTWKERLKAVRALKAVDAAQKMDRARTHSSGRRKPQHRSEA